MAQHDKTTSPRISAEIEAQLRAASAAADEALDIASLALAFAEIDQREKSRTPYLAHLAELADAARMGLAKADLARFKSADQLATALADIMTRRFSYRGDSETYDDLKNADLMHVIDRRKGLPVALGILYLHMARALGLDMTGLNFPGHFLLRLQVGADAAIIDPFNGGQVLTPADLLHLLRTIEGPDARLTPDHYAPVAARDILLRLQNNILGRALRSGDLETARRVLTRMIWLAPARSGLQFELGRLEVHAGHMGAAATAFAHCRDMAAGEGEMQLAQMAEEALRRLKSKLN